MSAASEDNAESEFLAFLADELTNLACLRQGISIGHLLPLQCVGSVNLDPLHERVRWEQLEQRRHNKIEVVRKERASLVAHIMHLNKADEEDLQLELELLLRCSEMLCIPSAELTEADVAAGFGTFMDEGEEFATQELIRRSIQRRDAKMKKICAAGLRDNSAEEVSRFMDRELRQVNKEKQLADESDKLRERARQRNIRLKELERQVKAEAKVVGEEKSRRRMEKIERIRAANEESDRMKQDRLAELARQRAERGERKLVEKTREQLRVVERRQQKTELVKERQGLVAYTLEQNTRLATDKLECKLGLHEQRCANKQLKRACEKEVRKIQKLQHQVGVTRFKKEQEEDHEGRQLVVFEKLAAHSERYAHEKQTTFNKLRKNRERENELHYRAAERRNLLELQRVQGINHILLQDIAKERHLEEMQGQKEAMGAARIEMNLQKQICMSDNKTRIERIREYKLAVSAEKVKHDILREKRRKEQQQETARMCEERAKDVRIKKGRMRDEIRKGRSPPRLSSAPSQPRIADITPPHDTTFDANDGDAASNDSAVYSIDDLSPLEDMYLIELPKRTGNARFKFTDVTDEYTSKHKEWSPNIEFSQYCRPQQRRPIYSAPVQLRR